MCFFIIKFRLFLKAEHIFISNGSPGGVAPGVIVFPCVNNICPALYRESGFLFPAPCRRGVSVTDGTKVYDFRIYYHR